MGLSLRRAVLVRFAGVTAAPAIGLLSAPILARGLGVEGRGAVGAATMPLILLGSFLTLGLPDAVTYFVARRPAAAAAITRRATLFTLATSVLGALCLFAFAAPITGHHPAAATSLRACAALLIPTLLLGVARSQAAARQQWMRLTVENFVTAVTRLMALGLLLAVGHLSVLSASLTVAGSTTLGLVAYAGSRIEVRGGEAVPHGLITYGLKAWLGTASGIALVYLDQVLMTPLASTAQLGFYAVAVSVAQVASLLNAAMASVTFAHESAAPDKERIARRSSESTVATAIACITVGIASSVLLPPIFGQEFTPALQALYVLLLGIALGNPGSIVGWGLVALGRPELRSISIATAAVCNLFLILLWVPEHGAVGAAWATVAGSFIASSMNILWLSIAFSVHPSAYVTFRKRSPESQEQCFPRVHQEERHLRRTE